MDESSAYKNLKSNDKTGTVTIVYDPSTKQPVEIGIFTYKTNWDYGKLQAMILI